MRGFSLAHHTATVPEPEVERHLHEDAHFVLVLAGAYVTSARRAPPVCDRPVLVYNPPGTVHRDRFRSRDGRFFTLSVAAPTLKHAAECVRLPDTALLLRADLLSLARRLARESRNADGASALIVEALALELLARVGSSVEREPGAPPAWLSRAREMLFDGCGDEISVASMAAVAGVHPVHLTRTFRRHYACTPGDYLRRCRLERAASLLATSTRPIAEIALASGFSDQSHLTRAFRRAYRASPASYRRGTPRDGSS